MTIWWQGRQEDYESLCTLPSYEVTNTSWSNKLDKKDPRSRTKAVWELTVGWKTVRALLGWACTASLAWADWSCSIILWQEPANISKNLQFILYTLHTLREFEFYVIKSWMLKILPNIYCIATLFTMQWLDPTSEIMLVLSVHTCLAKQILKMTWHDEERWAEDASVLTIMHQEPGLTGPESYFTLE